MEKIQLADVLEKFVNGEERYNADPVFKKVIDSLVGGIGVYAVLDAVLAAQLKARTIQAETIADLRALNGNLINAVTAAKLNV